MALKTYYAFKLPMKKKKGLKLEEIRGWEKMSEAEQASDPRITITTNERAKLLIDYKLKLKSIARKGYGASDSEADEMVSGAISRFWTNYHAKFRMDPTNPKEEEKRLFRNYFLKICSQSFGKEKKKARKITNVTAFSLEEDNSEQYAEEAVADTTYVALFIEQGYDEVGLDVEFKEALARFKFKIIDYGFGPATLAKILEMIDMVINQTRKVCWSHMFRSNRFNVKVRKALKKLYLESGFGLCPIS